MPVRRAVVLPALTVVTAVIFFSMGQYSAEQVLARQQAESDARIDALRAEMLRAVAGMEKGRPAVLAAAGTSGALADPTPAHELLVREIKQQLQDEMGLVPVELLRERRASFVELYAYDSSGTKNYGTAGYLGHGYFVTVKHAVVALKGDTEQDPRTITSVKIIYKGTEIPARVIDTGNADVAVHSGDWAIIKTKELDLPALRVDTSFAYEFADPIFRLGNDYSKGIILGTGYVGQRQSTGLVTCLTDGHPGVSGGGVLDQRGDLVGIPIGRMQGDYRFSFILPMRPEMLRKVPVVLDVNNNSFPK